jgi:predicted phosphodiesterase
MAPQIPTRILILSDTHGLSFEHDSLSQIEVDVVIHCGDLTEHSKLAEFDETIQLLREIQAPLKLAIAGNHDFSLDKAAFETKIAEAERISLEDIGDLIAREYGAYGAARQVWLEAGEQDNILLLDEGTHQFTFENGTSLKVYASPYTPSTGEWGFQYTDSHDFDIPEDIDIAITHGPPRGIMDMTAEKMRIGCPDLFRAIVKAQPRVHCFGHVHNGWGAKMIAWRPDLPSDPSAISHFTAINNDDSFVIESMATMRGSRFETEEEKETRMAKVHRYEQQGYRETSHCETDDQALRPSHTLFVNAANKGDDGLTQLPWLLHVDLEPSPGAAVTVRTAVR